MNIEAIIIAREKKCKHNWFYSPATFSKYCPKCHTLKGIREGEKKNKLSNKDIRIKQTV